MCSEMTECLDSSNFILLRCSLTLVLNCLLVCPTYETSQSLQYILYTTFLVCVCSVLSLCTLMKLLILFKILKPVLRLEFLIKEAVISEILRMYGIAKYLNFSLCVTSVFFWYCSCVSIQGEFIVK